jgi:hypothetical protein
MSKFVYTVFKESVSDVVVGVTLLWPVLGDSQRGSRCGAYLGVDKLVALFVVRGSGSGIGEAEVGRKRS